MHTFVFVEDRSRKKVQLEYFPDKGKNVEGKPVVQRKKKEKKEHFWNPYEKAFKTKSEFQGKLKLS